MKKVMDRERAEGFYHWLEASVPTDERHEVEQAIHALLNREPSLLAEGASWETIRVRASAEYAKWYQELNTRWSKPLAEVKAKLAYMKRKKGE